MKKNNKLPLVIGIAVFLVIAVILLIISRKPKANTEAPQQIETPPQVQKVNDIPLAQRPFVTMLIRPAEKQCEGMDLVVDSLKNSETKFDYFMEYTTKKGLIEVVNGNRDLTVDKKHDPLLFGTCSSGACTCQQVVDGSLKLTFTGEQEYVLKNDFVYVNVGEKNGVLKSKDLRLTLEIGNTLPARTNVLIGSSFGLPTEFNDKVILGPYYISSNGVTALSKPISASFQTKDATSAKVSMWNGEKWEDLESTIEGDKVTFKMTQLGVIVLTE